jgi:GTP cyclohydrolase I
MTQGYQLSAHDILNSAKFHEDVSEMIVVKDIEVYSMCEHHMLPFFGKAHVAYIPNGWITGLSKIARVVDVYSRRMQVQERLTMQIRDAIKDTLNPLGVAVVIEAKHLCMMMRGVQKQNSTTTTSAFDGEFQKNSTRSEFLKLISSKLS